MKHRAWGMGIRCQVSGVRRQRAAVLSSHRASSHMAAPSLGHYASLSFVVNGKGQRSEVKIKDCMTDYLVP